MNENTFCLLENCCSLPIDGLDHLENYLNYLLRTDKRQKWTVSETENNEIVLVDSQKRYRFDDLTSRSILKDRLKNNIEDFFSKNYPGQDLDSLVSKYIRVFCLHPFDFCTFDWVERVPFDDFNLRLIVQCFDNVVPAHLFALIYHLDQKNKYQQDVSHVHGLFFVDEDGREEDYDVMFDILMYLPSVWCDES